MYSVKQWQRFGSRAGLVAAAFFTLKGLMWLGLVAAAAGVF